MSQLLTPNEAAEALNTSKENLLAWARSGRIPAIRLSSRHIRFDIAAVLEALGVPPQTAEPAKPAE